MNTATKARAKAFQVILFASLVLLVIGLAGIFSGFNGLIVVKVGIQGGQIIIDSRTDMGLPKALPEIY